MIFISILVFLLPIIVFTITLKDKKLRRNLLIFILSVIVIGIVLAIYLLTQFVKVWDI